jgi:hypothetical protein
MLDTYGRWSQKANGEGLVKCSLVGCPDGGLRGCGQQLELTAAAGSPRRAPSAQEKSVTE